MSEAQTVGELVDNLPEPRRPAQAITPMQMLQIAIERGTDVVMLEKLMGLQERWEANEAAKAFVTALSSFKAKPPTVIKNKHVSYGARGGTGGTEYDHATLDQVCGVIGAALSEHGLSHRWETTQADGKIRVTCILTHRLGHSERVSLEAGADASGSKNPIQAIGSTVTYLERYTLLAVTGLAAKDQDDDARQAVGGFITDEQAAELEALIADTKSDKQKFLDYLCPGARTVEELPASQFAAAKAALAKKRTKP